MGPISYRTSARISPTFGSKPTNGWIASLSTSVKESASARCAAIDKMDHHLECQANSAARFKCGSSELALYFARLPTQQSHASFFSQLRRSQAYAVPHRLGPFVIVKKQGSKLLIWLGLGRLTHLRTAGADRVHGGALRGPRGPARGDGRHAQNSRIKT